MREQSTRFRSRDQRGTPIEIVALVLLVIFTQAAALLMNQPAAYWLNHQFTSLNVPFDFLLSKGPILYLGIVITYLAVVGWLVNKLNSTTGLTLSGSLVLIHSMALFHTTSCGLYPLYEVQNGTTCLAFRHIPFVLIFIVFGSMLLAEHFPRHIVTWSKKILPPLGVLWIILLAYGIGRAAFPLESPWQPLTPGHSPGPRTLAAVAYDTHRQRAVLFGGISSWDGNDWVYDNSTWEWDGKDWYKIETPIAPSGRILHAMAYDESVDKVILYGGQNGSGNLGDLWEWDGRSWRRLCPVCNPTARFNHKMIFDTRRQETVIYGGQDGKVGFAEGWTWNGQSWTYFQFDTPAPALYGAPLIYDSARAQAVSNMGGDWGGTWIWKEAAWSKLDLTVQPPLRDYSVFVYDPILNQSVLYGGVSNTQFLFDDTWLFKEGTWTKLDTPSAPPQRSRAVAFYDPTRRSIIMFGGEGRGSIYNDMWELTLPEGN